MTADGGPEDWSPVTLRGPRHDLPGRLLALEGPDGSGKSRFVSWLTAQVPDRIACTHVLMPSEHLRRYPHWYRDRRETDDGSVPVELDPVADTGLAVMAVGDRLVRQCAVVEPALRQGHLVLVERFALTPLVFKSAPMFSELLSRLYRPDLGLLFDAPGRLLDERVAVRAGGTAPRPGGPDRQPEVDRFRLLARANGYHVVDTSRPTDYAELEPLLRDLLTR
jgi:thymidylate kinase